MTTGVPGFEQRFGHPHQRKTITCHFGEATTDDEQAGDDSDEASA